MNARSVPRRRRTAAAAVLLAGVLAVPLIFATTRPAAAASGAPAVPAAAADPVSNVNTFSRTQPGRPDFGTRGRAAETLPGADVPLGMGAGSPGTPVHQ